MRPPVQDVRGMTTRRQFLKAAAASVAGAASAMADAGAVADDSVSFFLAGDTHYFGDEVEKGAMNGFSADINGRLIDWMNRLPGTAFPDSCGGGKVPSPHGVVHAGDLIDSGDKGPGRQYMAETELQAFVGDWGLNGGDGRLLWPVREVYGNHDSPGGDGPVISEIKARNKRRQGLTSISDNGLHYSWDWGGVHFVALGIVVGDAPSVSRRRRYAPLGSLPFLATDLAATPPERPVILVHHVDAARYSRPLPDADAVKAEWDYGDVNAFYDIIKSRRVAATLFGHTHARNLYRWDGTPNQRAAAGITAINTDNASHWKSLKQAILHLEIAAGELRVREFATDDAWQTGAWNREMWRFTLPS